MVSLWRWGVGRWSCFQDFSSQGRKHESSNQQASNRNATNTLLVNAALWSRLLYTWKTGLRSESPSAPCWLSSTCTVWCVCVCTTLGCTVLHSGWRVVAMKNFDPFLKVFVCVNLIITNVQHYNHLIQFLDHYLSLQALMKPSCLIDKPIICYNCAIYYSAGLAGQTGGPSSCLSSKSSWTDLMFAVFANQSGKGISAFLLMTSQRVNFQSYIISFRKLEGWYSEFCNIGTLPILHRSFSSDW